VDQLFGNLSEMGKRINGQLLTDKGSRLSMSLLAFLISFSPFVWWQF
jgi:hypothetical protein